MSLSINGKKYTSLHFIGILGSGMSAIAQYLRWQSMDISGSDRLFEENYTKFARLKLSEIGCRLFNQDGSGINNSTEAVVISTAIEKNNPDIINAAKRGIPVFHRSDVLSSIVNTKNTIAVAGTSGKSTVCAMIFHFLSHCDTNPSLISGANLNSLLSKGFIGNAFYGNSDLLVIEADESDGSIIKYLPRISIILNISKDHKTIPETQKLFQTLAEHSLLSIVNNDDIYCGTIAASLRFGKSADADFRAESLESNKTESAVSINGVRFSIPHPGLHNAQNLFASLCVCSQLKCDNDLLREACSTFSGIQRRFDIHHIKNGISVIDDFAHNPEKIRAAVSTAQTLCNRLIILFQPHGFGPTRFMFDELVSCFSEIIRPADILILLPIYYIGGSAQKDVSSNMIADALQNSVKNIFTPSRREDAISIIASLAEPNDHVISMGARDPSLPEFAKEIAEAIENKFD